MAIVTGATNASQAPQVQQAQSTPKIVKPATNSSSAPQDTVTISSQGRAAQQAGHSQANTGGTDHDGDAK
ncbi:MAG TPA: hypothetical protein VMB47_12185 [Candidatus Aquilonibacter sp.]|nr:hypothetical protein [Candidatus Aquilonibacter sp.]